MRPPNVNSTRIMDLNIARAAVKLLYDISLGPRELKMQLGQEKIVRSLLQVLPSCPQELQQDIVKIFKNLSQIPENIELLDKYDTIEIFCSLISSGNSCLVYVILT